MMMTTDRRARAFDVTVFVSAVLAVLGGFGLLRLSATLESYWLLVLAFVLMVWGLVVVFTDHGRPWHA